MRTEKTFTLDQIEDALHDTDIQWDEDFTEVVRTDYSGRGMYGESCFGLVLSRGAMGDIYSLVRAMVGKGLLDEDQCEDVDFMRGVVYPRVQWPETELKTETSRTPVPIPSELAQRSELGDQFRRGLLVTDVNTGGPAYKKLIEERDIIVEILNPAPRHAVTSQGDLDQTINSLKSGQYVTVLVYNIDGRATRVESIRVQ